MPPFMIRQDTALDEAALLQLLQGATQLSFIPPRDLAIAAELAATLARPSAQRGWPVWCKAIARWCRRP